MGMFPRNDRGHLQISQSGYCKTDMLRQQPPSLHQLAEHWVE